MRATEMLMQAVYFLNGRSPLRTLSDRMDGGVVGMWIANELTTHPKEHRLVFLTRTHWVDFFKKGSDEGKFPRLRRGKSLALILAGQAWY